MAHAHLLDPSRIGPIIAARLEDDRWLALQSELIAGGKSNLTFRLSCDAGQLILRRPPEGDLLPSAHDMGREAQVQRALAPTAVPVPEILLEDRRGTVLGAPFYIMSFIDGHVIRESLPPGYASTAEDKLRLVDALVDTLAELHAVTPGEVGLQTYGRPSGFVERQIGRWTEQWKRSKTEDVRAVDQLADMLIKSQPKSQGEAIVHGDFRLDNCVMDRSDPGTIAAVIDWELSTLGDPLADLGMLLFYWRELGEAPRLLTPSVTSGPDFPSRQYVLDRYAAQTGRDVSEVAFYYALAHFKFAVIAQGVAARVATDSMAGQHFGDLDEEVTSIAEHGLSVLASDAGV
jgi:aminoglycoside phosphotransferase (APT) family kinase protein